MDYPPLNYSSGQEKNILVSGNAGDEKNLHPGGAPLLFVEKKRPSFQCLKGKKRKFVRMNLLVENRLNGKFY